MPEPTVDSLAPNGIVNLNDAPGALDDATFDSLFPAEPTPVVAAPQAQPTLQPGQQPTTTQPPQVAAPAAPFLKGDRSVYNTAEAATQGINQKDALIEQLRQRYALTTGIDPITGQPVGQNAPIQDSSYSANPSKYLDDLYNAAKQGGPQAYVDVQTKFLMDALQPLQPLMQRMAREQAVQTLSSEIKDAATFIGSSGYQKALDANPELKDAIAVAESDMKWHSRLPGLYKLAYLTGQGLQLPEILKAQASQTPTQTNPVQHRPTAQSTTSAMPTQTAKPSFKNLEGIRAVIADAEARGVKLEF